MEDPTPRTIRRDARRILESADNNHSDPTRAGQRSHSPDGAPLNSRNLLAAMSGDGTTEDTDPVVENRNNAGPYNSNNYISTPSRTTSAALPLMGQTQALWSILLAVIPMIYLFVVGSFLLLAPAHFLESVFSCFDKQGNKGSNHAGFDNVFTESPMVPPMTMLEVRMARLLGCVLVGQILSCASLVYPLQDATFQGTSGSIILHANNPKHTALLDKFRSAVASLSIMGLLVFMAGLIDDRTSFSKDSNTTSLGDMSVVWEERESQSLFLSAASCSTFQSTIIVASGALVLVFSSASMMVSFWPISSSSINDNASLSVRNTTTTARQQRTRRMIDTADGDAQTPLLSRSNQEEEEEETLELEAQTRESTTSTAIVTTNGAADSSSDNDEPTSRIQGTTRLLKLAAPQVFYLYVGCAVLLIRLPFSLSIPHFISTALGAVSRGDFAGARSEILLLFILGVRVFKI